MKVDNLSYITLVHEFCRMNELDEPVYTTTKTDSAKVIARLNVGIVYRLATEIGELKACQAVSKEMYTFLWRAVCPKGIYGENALGQPCLNKDPGYVADIVSSQPVQATLPPWMKNIRIVEYGRALTYQFDHYKRLRAYEALLSTSVPELQLTRAAAALDREVLWDTMPTKPGYDPLVVAEIPHTIPSVIVMGNNKEEAVKNMIKYLKTMLLLHESQIVE